MFDLFLTKNKNVLILDKSSGDVHMIYHSKHRLYFRPSQIFKYENVKRLVRKLPVHVSVESSLNVAKRIANRIMDEYPYEGARGLWKKNFKAKRKRFTR